MNLYVASLLLAVCLDVRQKKGEGRPYRSEIKWLRETSGRSGDSPMLKAMKWSATALLILFVAAQFVRPAKTNPVFDEANAIQVHVEMDAEVSAILSRACYDCHSNKTDWPWYSKVAPMSWLVISHVNDGRRHLNFSEWEKYDRSKAVKKLHEIDEEVGIKAMPLSSYTLLHSEARLSDQERTLVSNWAKAASTRLEAAAARH